MSRRPGDFVLRLATAVLMLAVAIAGTGCSSGEPADPTELPAADGPGGRSDEARFWQEFRAATAARRGGDRMAAIRGYEAALERRPEHADARYYAAQLRYARGEVDRALEHLRALAEIEPRRLRAWQQLSVVHGTPRAGWLPDLEAAAGAAREALRLHPSESRNHLLAGRWAAYGADWTTARGALETALGHNPDLEDAYLLQVWLESVAGDSRTAGRIGTAGLRHLCGSGSCAGAAGLQLALAAQGHAPDDVRLGPFQAPASPRLARRPGARWRADVDPVATGEAVRSSSSVLGDAEGGPELGVLELVSDTVVLIQHDEAGHVQVLPAATSVPAWSSPEDAAAGGSARPVPWRAVMARGMEGPELWIAGGGDRPLRRHVRRGTSWVEERAAGIPTPISGFALAAIDLDGDGSDELFVADVIMPRSGTTDSIAGERAGIVLGRDASGEWSPRSRALPGPWAAAASLDVDRDGDDDLVLARAPAGPTAPGHLLRRLDAEAPELPATTVFLFLNDQGELRQADGWVPPVRATVQDLAPLTIGGVQALYLATGGLAPERSEPDRLWLLGSGRWVDDSPRLGRDRFGRTLRVVPLGRGRVLLQRGGLLPGDLRGWSLLELGG